jgi:serine phosphatase RsbU (regulator of sigma subunit)
MVKRGRTVGGLSFITTTGSRSFTEQDVALARVVAGRVASSLENRRLSDQQRTIAATLQASLLPGELPEVPGLDVAVRYWAAGEATVVGGDFYDVIEIGDDRWGVVIGDVCGTGPAAAALTSMARHTIRQAAWRGDDPVTVLQWLNRATLAAVGRSCTFLTVSYVTIEPGPEGLAVTATNAGHPCPVVVRRSGEGEPLGEHGRLLGVYEEVTAEPHRTTLGPGDTLVLYTDGLTDVPPPHLLTGEETVELVAAAAHGAADADEVAGRLEEAIARRLAVHQRPDDIALVVLRATGKG